eukprot:7387568-Prymnesium_polylepis.2
MCTHAIRTSQLHAKGHTAVGLRERTMLMCKSTSEEPPVLVPVDLLPPTDEMPQSAAPPVTVHGSYCTPPDTQDDADGSPGFSTTLFGE